MEYLFYTRNNGPLGSVLCLPVGLTWECWKPSGREIIPRGLSLAPFAVWWLFHRLAIFSNTGYSLVLIRSAGRIIHRSCVFPKYFRFPFMQAADLQVGDTYTDEEFRGRGLASLALQYALESAIPEGRLVWYVVEETNTASVRVAEKCGFRCLGRGVRTRPLSLAPVGQFRLLTRES